MPTENAPQELRLENREKLTVSGVSAVESYDENVVALATSRGLLVVRGEELHLQSLSIDGGCVTIHGQIAGLNYEELRKSGGFLRRLLG